MTSVLENVCTRRTDSKSNNNCCVYGCNSVAKKNPELLFHSFPPEGQKIHHVDDFGSTSVVERRKLWIIKLKIGKPVSKYMRVCSRHFVDQDYVTPNEACYTRRYLKKTALPSQHLPLGVVDKQKQIRKERRFVRLMKRRQAYTNENDEKLEEKKSISSTSEIEVAECLLELQRTLDHNEANTFVANNKFINVGIQTDEVSFCMCKNSRVSATKRADAEVQVVTKWLSLADFVETDKALNILTGIASFKLLFFLINLLSTYTDTRNYILSIKERILLVFLKLKLDLTYSALCVLFKDISVTTCKKIFEETVQALSHVLKVFIILPTKENILMNMPICFAKYQNVRIILDCTEIRVQSPKKLCCRIKLYSHYKKNHTIKFMTGVTPGGIICYVSPSYGGRSSDKSIFEQSKLLDHLIPFNDEIMVDKGFLIDNVCADYGIKIVRPPFLKKKKQVNKRKATDNRSIAAARVHIERSNARIKIFRIFRNTFPLHLVPIIDDIFVTICGVVNLSSSIMRDDLFLK